MSQRSAGPSHLFIVSKAFRPYASAAAAALFAAALLITSLATNNADIRWLAAVSALFFLIVAIDAAIPCKLRIDDTALRYRNTFVWTSWPLTDVSAIHAVDSTWLGLSVTSLSLHMTDGRVVALPDVMAARGCAGAPGGPVWAGREVAAVSGGRVRFVGVEGGGAASV